jgi:hypothetical protein
MLTDALNEAKDNTKHLAALGHFFEPLYSGNVAQMLDCLPGACLQGRLAHKRPRYRGTSLMRNTDARPDARLSSRCVLSTVAYVNRVSTFALGRSTFGFCLGGQRSLSSNRLRYP